MNGVILRPRIILTCDAVWTEEEFCIQHEGTEVVGGVKVQLHDCLTLALDGGEWLATRPGRFTTR
jgi:hypothetical protein